MKKFKLKIGGDPEFNIIYQGMRVSANEILEKAFKGKNREGSNGYKTPGGYIGEDGASSTAEIRMSPASTPEEFVANIRKVLDFAAPQLTMFKAETVSGHAPVGGHIHLEMPKLQSGYSPSSAEAITRRIGTFLLPVLMSENPLNSKIRLKTPYGKASDFRIEKKFTHDDGINGYTLEVRSPSAEWLTSPKVTMAVASYLMVVWHELFANNKNITKHKDLIFKSRGQMDALQTLMISEYSFISKMLMKKLHAAVKTFERYNDYKEHIDFLFRTDKVIEEKQKYGYDIFEGWGYTKQDSTKSLTKRSFISDKEFKKLAKDKDIDSLKSVLSVYCNDDMNVQAFESVLVDRTIAHGMKLENVYCLYGIRKGVEGYVVTEESGRDTQPKPTIKFYSGHEMIKTEGDMEVIRNLVMKMRDKFMMSADVESAAYRNAALIDWKSNKITKRSSAVIYIGIPYDTRKSMDFKSFLELIYDIETGKKKPVEDEKIKLKDNSPVEGNLFACFQKVKNAIDKDEIQPDHSQSSSVASNARSLVADEEQNEHRQETALQNVCERVARDAATPVASEAGQSVSQAAGDGASVAMSMANRAFVARITPDGIVTDDVGI